jgi:hypothetical protein
MPRLGGLRFSASKFQAPPYRAVAIHQDAGLHAHLAIERLHRDALLPAREESLEVARGRDEVRVLGDLQLASMRVHQRA